MALFTTTQNFGPYRKQQEKVHVIIDAGTGSIAINAVMSDGTKIGIDESPFSADKVLTLDVANGTFEVAVTGDARFEWTDDA